MISMFLLSLFVNLFIKVIVWLIKQNLDGKPISADKQAKLSEAIWLANRLHVEAGRAGMGLTGSRPADWTEDDDVLNARLEGFGLSLSQE